MWADRTCQNYLSGDCNGLYLKVTGDLALPDLDELRLLPGLRYLEVEGPVVDDTAAFTLDSLQELILLTRCRLPIPSITAPGLRRVGIEDRDGKENLAHVPSLRDLKVWYWRETDFRCLRSARGLTRLHVGGVGQLGSLDGLEHCTSLVDLAVFAVRVPSLEPLASLSRLRRFRLLGEPNVPNDAVLDLAHLSGLADLVELWITYSGSVRSVRPLLAMPRLCDVRMRGTPVLDGDDVLLMISRRRWRAATWRLKRGKYRWTSGYGPSCPPPRSGRPWPSAR